MGKIKYGGVVLPWAEEILLKDKLDKIRAETEARHEEMIKSLKVSRVFSDQ